MKKIISLLLCFCMLFSLAVFSTAEETQDETKPTVYIRVDQGYLRSEDAEYARSAYVHAEVFNCPDFEKCEIVVKAPAFALNDPKPERKLREYYDYAEEYDYSDSINSTNTTLAIQKSEDDVFTIHMQTPLSGKLHPFAHIMFATQDRTVHFEPVFESIRLYSAEGEILDFETKIYNPIGQELLVPQVCGILTFGTTWNKEPEYLVNNPYGKLNVSVSMNGIASASGVEAVLVYNPEVLQFVAVELPEVEENPNYLYADAGYKLIEPGKVHVFCDLNGYVSSFARKIRIPFEFECIAEGESGLAIESYTWLYNKYTSNYVRYAFDTPYIMKAVDFETFDDMPEGAKLWNHNQWGIGRILLINGGQSVAEFRKTLTCNSIADIRVYKPDGREMEDNEIVGTGCVYKVFYADRQYYSQKLYVLYDLDGDGYRSAADARFVLRASVGLEKNIKDEQRHCCLTNGELTAALARRILRTSVGLPAE